MLANFRRLPDAECLRKFNTLFWILDMCLFTMIIFNQQFVTILYLTQDVFKLDDVA